MRGLTLDSGALIAIEKGGAEIRRQLREQRDGGGTITVPAVVVAQAWKGNVPEIAIALRSAVIEPFTADLAKPIGELLARARLKDVVDAAVAYGAHLRGDLILTSDHDDLERLLAKLEPQGRALVVRI